MVGETTLGLDDQDWTDLLKLPAPALEPCCPWIERLRDTLGIMWHFGPTLYLIDRFQEQYALCCELHDMSYSKPLLHLANHFQFSDQYIEYCYA
jgi:hypothetical protein